MSINIVQIKTINTSIDIPIKKKNRYMNPLV